MTISTKTWFTQNRKIINKHYIKKRLNFKFIIGIFRKIYLESKNKNKPWLTNDSIKFLSNWIKPDDVILEFGSGQSTIWFAKRTKHVTSIEHNKKWYRITQKYIKNSSTKANLILGTNKNKYLKTLKKFSNNSIDICLVDGEWRRDCLLGVFNKIKKGGMIILDNAETYLPILWPSNSFQDSWIERGSPEKIKVSKIMTELKKWRIISTTDVSQDTIMFIKK